MEEILGLFEQCFVPDSEVIRRAEMEIFEKCKDPNAILVFCEVVEKSEKFRRAAIVLGIRTWLKMHLSEIGETEVGAVVKQHMGVLMRGLVHDRELTDNLVHALRGFVYSKDYAWMIEVVRENRTAIGSLVILREIVDVLEGEVEPEFAKFVLDVVVEVIGKSDAVTFVAAAQVFAEVCHGVPEEAKGAVVETFQVIVKAFLANTGSLELAKAIAKCLDFEDRFMEPTVLFGQMMEHVKENVEVVFVVLRKIVSVYGCLLRGVFRDLIQFALNVGASMFSGLCCDEEGDAKFVISIVSKCARALPPKDFMELFVTFLRGDTPNMVFAVLVALDYVADDVQSVILEYERQIVDFLMASLNVEHHGVREMALGCISEIEGLCSQVFEMSYEKMLPLIMTQLSSGHEKLVEMSILAISSVLYHGSQDIPSEMIIHIARGFLQAFPHAGPSMKANIILALGACADGLGEQCVVLGDEVVSLLLQGTKAENLDIVAQSIQAFAIFLYAARDGVKDSPLVNDNIKDYLLLVQGVFVQAVSNGDTDNALLDAAFFALSMMARTSFGIDPFLETAVVCGLGIMQKMNNPDTSITAEMLATTKDVLSFITVVVKRRPGAVKRWEPVLPQIALLYMQSPDEEIAAASSILAGHLKMMSEQFWQALRDNFYAESEMVAGSAFMAVDILLRHGVEIPLQLLQLPLTCAIEIFKREHPCFKESHGDEMLLSQFHDDVSIPMIRLLASIARIYPQQFPMQEFMNTISSLIPSVTKEEIHKSLAILASYIRHAPDLSPDVLGNIFEFAWSLVQPELSCDEPYILLRAIFERSPQLLTPDKVKALFELPQSRSQVLLARSSLLLSYSVKVSPINLETTTNLIANLYSKGNIDELRDAIGFVILLITGHPEVISLDAVKSKFKELLASRLRRKFSPELVAAMEKLCL